ncbi:MAG: hypothetical protein HY695_30225 [Deltaproteobacteria bacterium]|nr:hypothetical protein [Deltaproteobacteria bacterium]
MAANRRRIGFLTPLAGLLLVLVLVNVLVSLGNQFLRVEVTERQQFITQSIQLEALSREIVTALLTIAVKNKDDQLMSLLASHGISVAGEPKASGGAK